MVTSNWGFQWRLRRIVTKIDKITPGCRGWVGYGRWGGGSLFAYFNVVKHVDGVPEKRSSLRPLWLWGYCDGNTVGCSGPSLFHPLPTPQQGIGMELPSWRLEESCEVYLHSTFTHYSAIQISLVLSPYPDTGVWCWAQSWKTPCTPSLATHLVGKEARAHWRLEYHEIDMLWKPWVRGAPTILKEVTWWRLEEWLLLLQIVGKRNFQDHRIAFPETQTCVRPGLVQQVESITWSGVGGEAVLVRIDSASGKSLKTSEQGSISQAWQRCGGSRQGQRERQTSGRDTKAFFLCLLIHPTVRWRCILVNTSFCS